MTPYTVVATKDDGSSCSLEELSVVFEKRVIKKLDISVNLSDLEARHTGLKRYLANYLRVNLSAIIRATPDIMTTFIAHIKTHFALPITKESDAFLSELYKTFSYDRFRSSIDAAWLATRLNVKTCLYCNTAFTLVVDKKVKKSQKQKALLEFDHFHPKDLYPYLSLSFFNLIPVCGNCNRLLSKTEKISHPYLTHLDDLFTVSLTKDSLNACRLNSSSVPIVDVEYKTKDNSILDCLAIRSRYSHFANIAQEIVWRETIYTDDYLKELRSRLSNASLSREQANRFILGNYCDSCDYHKRPLAKFYADVGKQLGLLKR